ncbi:MAG TPA: hypothetical protein PLI95_03040 [Polyangiaceae bacterium]|nr:hypothetical protein [Polyangiaceae bacterium]
MSRVPAFMALGVALTSVGACCPVRTGQLTGRWVAIAGENGQGAGIATKPALAQPLALTAPSEACFSNQQLREHFGPGCEENEAEAAASPDLTDDPTQGNQPTPGEVHWYCDRRTVVRVVLARCPGTNTFRVRQLAVSIAAEGR